MHALRPDHLLAALLQQRLFLVGLVFLAALGTLDWLTGPQLDFSLFYLIPVGFVTWQTGPRRGLVVSVLSAGVWLMVDRLTGAPPSASLLSLWNFAMRVAFFSASVLLLDSWKRSGARLAAMVEQRTAALRRLATQLSAAEEAERRKLAHDMHDALSQPLSLIKMGIDSAQMDSSERPALQHRLAECGSMVDEVTRQTRTLMFDLYPAMLDDLGLVPTLQGYASQIQQRTGTEIVVSEHGVRQPLPTPVLNYLFRAAKELMNNAVKHGRASEISLLAHWEPATLRLVVDDDGIGFDVNAALLPLRAPHGLGLISIRERLRSMGGRLHLESSPGQGSRAIIEIPIGPELQLDDHDGVLARTAR